MKSILIIGGGSIGKRHLRNLITLEQTQLAVVEPDAARATTEIETSFGVKTFRSLDEAFAVQSFAIAFICSPSIFHMDQAIACAKNGMDLFIEKPLSHSLDGVDTLLSIIKEKKLITMVGCNWKFYPLFQKMKELLDSGAIGKVLSARCQFGQYLPDWHPWEDHRKGYSANKKMGGGILLDSHEFDYLTWFLGPVKKLACFADRVSDVTVDTEDVAEVILQFESGAVGEIHLDYLQRFYQRNFEFFGENGTIGWDTNQKLVRLRVAGKDEEQFPLPADYDFNSMYVDEVKHFLAAVEDRKSTIMPVAKGAKVLRLITAAKQSSADSSVVLV